MLNVLTRVHVPHSSGQGVKDKSHVLWKNKDLHDENAEKDQIGAGNVVFEGWQGCCSILEE